MSHSCDKMTDQTKKSQRRKALLGSQFEGTLHHDTEERQEERETPAPNVASGLLLALSFYTV